MRALSVTSWTAFDLPPAAVAPSRPGGGGLGGGCYRPEGVPRFLAPSVAPGLAPLWHPLSQERGTLGALTWHPCTTRVAPVDDT
ncbi:hypothetical protein GCM10022419_008180 [Nonomuraea rosea]|uniref:Uncharacterized protein n=1 Tax=Nonomuraea rosea TaxID=638574 RepID=A0ABP6V9V5_9ACTN